VAGVKRGLRYPGTPCDIDIAKKNQIDAYSTILAKSTTICSISSFFKEETKKTPWPARTLKSTSSYKMTIPNLEKIGIQVNTKFLNNTEYRDAEVNGDYHLLFTRSCGAPYDPHSYLASCSWEVPSHVEYSAIGNLQVRGVLVDGYSCSCAPSRLLLVNRQALTNLVLCLATSYP